MPEFVIEYRAAVETQFQRARAARDAMNNACILSPNTHAIRRYVVQETLLKGLTTVVAALDTALKSQDPAQTFHDALLKNEYLAYIHSPKHARRLTYHSPGPLPEEAVASIEHAAICESEDRLCEIITTIKSRLSP